MASPRYPTRRRSAIDEIVESELEIANMPRILEIQQTFKKDMAQFQHGLNQESNQLDDYRKVLNDAINDRATETNRLTSIKESKQAAYQDMFKEFYDPTTMPDYDSSTGNVENVDDSYLEGIGLLVNQFQEAENTMFNHRLKNIINEENELRYDIQRIDERIRQVGDIQDIFTDTYSPDLDTSDTRTIDAEQITDYQGNVIEDFPEKTFHLHSKEDVNKAMNLSMKYFNENSQKLNSGDISKWDWDVANDYRTNFENLEPWQKSALTTIVAGHRNVDEKNEKILDRIYKEEQYRMLRLEAGKATREEDYNNKVKARDQILNYLTKDNPVYGEMANWSTQDMTKWVLHQQDTSAQTANPSEWDKVNKQLTETIKNNAFVKAAGGLENFTSIWKRSETHPEVFIQQVWEPALRVFDGYAQVKQVIEDKVKAHNKQMRRLAKEEFDSSSKRGKYLRGKYKNWRQYLQSSESGFIYSTPNVSDDPNAMNMRDMKISAAQAYLESVSTSTGNANSWTTEDMALIQNFLLKSSPYSEKDAYQQPLFLNAQELLKIRESLGVNPEEVFYQPGWKGDRIQNSIITPSLNVIKEMNINELIKDSKKRRDTSSNEKMMNEIDKDLAALADYV